MQGVVKFNESIYMITWREHVVFKLKPEKNFDVTQQLKWGKIGWGLTTNETHMFTTDGSDKVYLVDKDFNLLETKRITDENGRMVHNINEL